MAKNKDALGRGLGELLGEIEEAYDNEVPKHHSVIEIPISEIRPNPFQPRKNFDDKSLHELSDSIKEHGLIQPIVVIEDIDGYVLVAGERRLRASKLGRLKTIRAVITSVDEQRMRQHALIENIQRDELNPIDLAGAYDELLKVHAITHDELAKMIHKSRAHITNTLRLLQVSKKVQKALVEGKINAGHAKVLVGLSEKEQNMLADSIVGQKLSVREVESMVKSMRNEQPASSKKPRESASLDFDALVDKLRAYGLDAKAKAKKLTIEFEDDAQIVSFLNDLH